MSISINGPSAPLQRFNFDNDTRCVNLGPFLRKPLPQERCSASESAFDVIDTRRKVERHLTLLDLVLIGIGGTIGSGLFVLCGLVAHDYAGPAAALSWAVAGVAACISGCCYAEMASQVPDAGSAYAYAYVAMGELFGILAASCLSLEYIMAASAVSRSWADKVTLYLIEELHVGPWVHDYLQPNLWSVSPLAFLISTATVMLLLNGVHQTKAITNFFTIVKVGVVAFMIITGFALASPSNWIPFVPPQFGVVSVIRGSTVTFFGYLGYDEVCQLAGDAINPKRNLPIAILVTLVGVTVVYIAAALSLTGMQSYENISSVSGFPVAFRTHGNLVAAQIAALGELLTLPVVVPLTIIGQPRLQYALAMDGLLPNWFGELDRHGNLYKGTVFCGIIFVALSTFVPFSNLNDMISAAVLTALNITDTSLILLWHQSPNEKPHLAENLLVMFHIACLVLSLLLMRYLHTPWGQVLCLVSAITMLVCMLGVHQSCPRCDIFGGQQRRKHGVAVDRGSFRTPFVPFWPCIGIFINWYLFAQLDLTGILGMLGFLAFTTAYYFLHGIHHSIGNNGGWVAESEFPAEHTSLVQLGRLAARQPLQ